MTIVALMRVVQDPISPPSVASSAWAQSSEDKSIESVCMQALSKNPDDRFPDAMAFADRLSKWLGEKPAKRIRDARSTAFVWIPAAILPVAIIIALIVTQANRAATPQESRWDQAANLLPFVDPVKDAVSGAWKSENGALKSGSASHTRIEIPWKPAAEYDLRVSFLRREGGDDVAVLLPWKGGTFVWTTRVPENGAVYTGVFRVRNDGLGSILSGPQFDSRDTVATRGPDDPKWALRNPALPGLGSNDGSVEFQRVEILEVTGKGARTRP
jgi:hypothetical protein